MAGKDDDFDEWLDDSDGLSGELDQDNIDQLFSAVESAGNNVDDQATAAKSGGELDQSNIDVLLGLNSTKAAAPENDTKATGAEIDQDNIDDLLKGSDYDADSDDDFNFDELEQDNIDALIAGSSDEAWADPAPKNIAGTAAQSSNSSDLEAKSPSELDQDDIDSLLSSDNSSAGETGEDSNLDAFFEEADLEQDNIDALFTNMDADPESADAPEEANLDELFAGNEKRVAETTDKESAELSPEDADDLATAAFDSDLDEMDKLFAGIDDEIEDEDPFLAEEIDFAEMLGQTEEDDQDFVAVDPPASTKNAGPGDDFMARAGAEDDSDFMALPDEAAKKRNAYRVVIPAALAHINRTLLAGVGGVLLLLLLVGLYFLFPGSHEIMEEQAEAPAPAQQAPAPIRAENFIPLTEDVRYEMGKEGGEVAITLAATDQDDQPLLYEIISQPLHGRLSGTAPHLTYLPDNTFPGQDRFEFMVSDGIDTSNSATITIIGPDLATRAKTQQEAAEAEAEQKILQPAKPRVVAQDLRYPTISTQPVTIDWVQIWQEANNSPYDPRQVHVEIVDTALKGVLTRGADRTTHIFTPDPYSAHSNMIRYRFKKGGFRSATKQVHIPVALGSPPPEINIGKLSDKGYLVGQNVVIDASASRDEARETLQFFWTQKAGVPVTLEPVNEEGSKVAFTMPSSFSSEADPGPTLVLTVVDKSGKKVCQEIKTKMVSRRQSALWRGTNGTLAADPPLEGRYFPWPFAD